MDKNTLSHTSWECKYYVVFAPKYRRQVIYEKIKADIGKILRELCERKDIEIIEAQLCNDHTIPGCFAWKQHGGMFGVAGLPDIICCIGGRFVAFEVKTPSGKLTKLQEIMIQRIKDAKGEAHKVTSVEDVKAILAALEVYVHDSVEIH